ncbi:MAG: MMPL family transporter [Trueperaceae bacterium]|nr:MAG: MMPL family transporter [Trueperaceae bacterium]
MQRVLLWGVVTLVVVVWLAASGIGGPYFGRLAEVQSQSNADFLPASAESTRALELQAAFSDEGAPPAIMVFTSVEPLGDEDLAALSALVGRVADLDGVAALSPLIPTSVDGRGAPPRALQAFATIDGPPDRVVERIRAVLVDAPAGIAVYVTGPAGFLADLVAAFGAIDGILLVVTVLAVLVILLAVYRSPVLPLVVLTSAIGALSVAVVAVFLMAQAGWITLNGQAQGILFILVIGATTDYALLFVSRFREALGTHERVLDAVRVAWRGAFEPILASGGTVVLGVLCLLASDLNSNRSLGPVAASGIVWAMLASLTFLPAMLALLGRGAFWPLAPGYEPADAVRERARRGFWARVAGLVARRPRTTWMATALVLVVAASFAPRFDADGVPQTAFVLGETESLAGLEVLGDFFSAGTGDPTIVIGSFELLEPLSAAVAGVAGVDAVVARTAGFGGGGPPGSEPPPPLVVEVDGRELIELQATLAFAPDSNAAIDVVREIRSSVRAVDPHAVVGGTTATDLDTRTTARADLVLIIPLVLVVITLSLMLLLRSVLAPLLLIATTVLSYLATIGISGLVFEHVFGFPGADPVVPLFAFVFLVALGIDYNIFLTSRIREEAPLRRTRPAVLEGLRVTGGVITSAGIVLAATFAALAVIPLLFLVQIAFIVAFGVLMDALVVRSLLVPGLLYDIGPRVWWPSRLAREDGDPAGRRRASEPAVPTA